MNPQNSGPKPRPAVAAALCDPERFIQETATAVRASFCHRVEDVKDYARQQPEKALLSALAAGYVLRGLPVFRIGSTFLRILVTLAKPVGIVYGAAKVWQKLQVAGPAKSSANSEKSAESAGKASGQ